ncbi:MAG: bifunctional diaminohydroxyphosphoribosylaminopyrimidine deaminase/5-amino-6-(5-phosphoribosylamino)uracil reductase RibD [Desulfobulbaceae bacterium]|jgi:diaminohydroxyphosphoribosylaminopyrimidine deaminase/5-amino-6-(5-phosphoribosylamino)uracil reductase|nr:bifunctional diaminohydroxyphosphoribosylaminopyrimidine deaminase/5-amino-6-(5-phosphoribosylamino)uracil reductase RibD [Desulfobulbaceae bacterium]
METTGNKSDSYYMAMAIRLAKKALGRTSPNPCVGAVVTRDGEVVGRGYHHQAGTPHAEAHALREAGERARGATIYVTLEPCNHTGRTPPCAQAVLAAGIARVVVGMSDPNPLVSGSGIRLLRQRGLDCVVGVLEEQCQAINRPFVKYITSGLPYVTMKAAITLDGRLNFARDQQDWLTGAAARQYAHLLRDRHDAILVGAGTAGVDDPSLNVRLRGRTGRDPLRVILDSHLALSPDAKVCTLASEAKTLVFCRQDAPAEKRKILEQRGVEVCPLALCREGRLDARAALRVLGERQICSLLVEGGAAVHGEFLRQRLYDEAHLLLAPMFAGENGLPLLSGFAAPKASQAPRLERGGYRRLGDDLLIHGLLRYF